MGPRRPRVPRRPVNFDFGLKINELCGGGASPRFAYPRDHQGIGPRRPSVVVTASAVLQPRPALLGCSYNPGWRLRSLVGAAPRRDFRTHANAPAPAQSTTASCGNSAAPRFAYPRDHQGIGPRRPSVVVTASAVLQPRPALLGCSYKTGWRLRSPVGAAPRRDFRTQANAPTPAHASNRSPSLEHAS
jgi:hypothetical protein